MPDLRFLFDANMPRSSVQLFRSYGHEVEDVRNFGKKLLHDKDIMRHAAKKKAVIVTRDKDFGEVINHPGHPGALILRLPATFTAEEINSRLELFLQNNDLESILTNSLVILEIERYRRRRIQ